jgi:hypothetical protein
MTTLEDNYYLSDLAYAMERHQYDEKIDENIEMITRWLGQDIEKKKEISPIHLDELEEEYYEIIENKIKSLQSFILTLENLKKDVGYLKLDELPVPDKMEVVF